MELRTAELEIAELETAEFETAELETAELKPLNWNRFEQKVLPYSFGSSFVFESWYNDKP